MYFELRAFYFYERLVQGVYLKALSIYSIEKCLKVKTTEALLQSGFDESLFQ